MFFFDFCPGFGGSSSTSDPFLPSLLQLSLPQVRRVHYKYEFFEDLPFFDLHLDFFGYEKVLPMNTGAEAVETALKLAKRWGTLKKVFSV